jgi:hypothetical protein
MDYATAEKKRELVLAAAGHGLELSQNAFGNYVVQVRCLREAPLVGNAHTACKSAGDLSNYIQLSALCSCIRHSAHAVLIAHTATTGRCCMMFGQGDS